MDGYFHVHRKLLSSDMWLGEKFTRGQAWIDLIGLARFSDGHFFVGTKRVPIKRGEVGWTNRALAERWKWSRGKVERFICELEETDHQTGHRMSNGSRLIVVINYDAYQPNGPPNGPATGHQQATNRAIRKKETKKQGGFISALANDRASDPLQEEPEFDLDSCALPPIANETLASTFTDWFNVYPKRSHKLEAQTAWCETVAEISAETGRSFAKVASAILRKTAVLASAVQPAALHFVPNPVDFLKQRRFLDDPATWSGLGTSRDKPAEETTAEIIERKLARIANLPPPASAEGAT